MTLHYIKLHLHYIYIALHYIYITYAFTFTLHYIYITYTCTLHYITYTFAFHYITFALHLHLHLHLHYITLHYTTLHYITLHTYIYIYIIRILLSWLHLVRAVGSGSRLFGLWRYAVGIGAEVDCGEHRDADPMALIMGLQGMPLEWKIFDFHISCDEKWGYHGICMGDTWFHGIDTLRQVAESYGKSVFFRPIIHNKWAHVP